MTPSQGNFRSSPIRWLLSGLCFVIALCQALPSLAEARQAGIEGMSQEEVVRLGERMYRDGILPSGEPVRAIAQGDLVIEATMFSCSSCHMRGGLGSNEGRVKTPPTNGKRLLQPAYTGGQADLSPEEFEKLPKLGRFPVRRPAYTDKTLAEALRDGVDPTGRVLDEVMPRYQLEDRDMAIMVAYLKQLSFTFSPGASETSLRFATVIAGDVRPEDEAAMLIPLQRYFDDRNVQVTSFEKQRKKYGWFAEDMARAYRRLSLARWELKGPPETWRGQLEEYYRQEPVFALLGGISNGEWRPVHEFSEAHRIPCILPITDYPVISENGWYTLYFSKGPYQEGEAAAHFLKRTIDTTGSRQVVQIFRDDRQGRALAAGFRETWLGLGLEAPKERALRGGEQPTRELVLELTGGDRSAVVFLWVGEEALPFLDAVAADAGRPEQVFLSSTQLGKSFAALPERARSFTYLTYPYRLPQDERPLADHAKMWLSSRKAPINERRISTRMYALISLMSPVFMHMKQDFYRDNMLDVISMRPDQPTADYERLSFGPGQQFASKGCYIVQVSPGEPRLVKKSDWVIH
ncbi:ABC transporter substrate-binding protein [Geomonas sp.]|uniref:ABC transporter substrate-binding protein n=1 Tax=Geomonas sp. TaxID=2651584 RepID=UPI002B48A948|nr:ABC transporter substrate-binding protein [Geomonas sp.]HJV36186.1 ABC transporter substrate-binding protein [Geomonas sp.]